MTLDIIMPHYKEPWSVGSKFFSMLDLQRDVDFKAFRVILVNDGEENALPDEYFVHRPYAVEQISIPKAGVSAARNAGLRASDAEWVMFCDFDDMFTHVFSIHNILNVLPAKDYDLLWTDFNAEVRMKDGGMKVFRHEYRAENIHAKLYRRSFLSEHGIAFDEKLALSEDFAFNTIAYCLAKMKRTAKISTESPIYLWCDTENSVTNANKPAFTKTIESLFSEMRVCDLFRERGLKTVYATTVATTVVHGYCAFCKAELTAEQAEMKSIFAEFYRANRAVFQTVPDATIQKLLDMRCGDLDVLHMKEIDRWDERIDKEHGNIRAMRAWLDDIKP